MSGGDTKKILWDRAVDAKNPAVVDGYHGETQGTLGPRGPTATSGFHHIALVVRDIQETIKFYEQALGMKLCAQEHVARADKGADARVS